jgi:hypothetical protein
MYMLKYDLGNEEKEKIRAGDIVTIKPEKVHDYNYGREPPILDFEVALNIKRTREIIATHKNKTIPYIDIETYRRTGKSWLPVWITRRTLRREINRFKYEMQTAEVKGVGATIGAIAGGIVGSFSILVLGLLGGVLYAIWYTLIGALLGNLIEYKLRAKKIIREIQSMTND